MFDIKNPSYVAPAPKPGAYTEHAAAVVAAIKANPAVEFVSFDSVRAALGLSAVQLPDGYIHQIALDADMDVKSAAAALSVQGA